MNRITQEQLDKWQHQFDDVMCPQMTLLITARTAMPLLIQEVKRLRDHCDAFCECPSHGLCLVHLPPGELT